MLYGRDAEIDAIGRLLDDARSARGGALVVRGAPGIGKSALLTAAREHAPDMQLLAARGIEAESDLPFAGVHQLLSPMKSEIDDLPEPEPSLLREAFGADVGSSRQRFVVYSACLTVLSDLAARSPILCLIDDAHWLDSMSSEALQFCARRLAREPIAMVFAARDDDPRRFDATDLPSLTLDSLHPDVSAALLRRTAEVSEVVAERILSQARGNPLALIELPRALDDAQLAGREPLPDELPLTAQLESSYAIRLRRLPDATQQVLLIAATDDSEDIRVVSRAAVQLELDPRSIDDAERAGLIRVQGSRVEFVHPLVRSAVNRSAPAGDRRAAHRALADALVADENNVDRRAWHLANAAVTPDDAIVHELDEAAARAERRGAHLAASRALERAAALSADRRDRAGRLLRAASNLSALGRDEHAVALTGQLDERLLEPGQRATSAFIRGSAAIRWQGRPADAIADLVSTARELAPAHPGLAVRLLPVATFAAWQAWDHSGQLDAARVAAAIDIDGLDATGRHLAESVAGFAAMLDGDRAGGAEQLRRTVEWGRTIDDAQQVIWASWAALWLGDDDGFAELLHRAVELSRRDGEIGTLAEALGMQSVQLSLLAQRYEASNVAADEAMRLANDLGAASLTLLPRSALAIGAAVKGDVDLARDHAGAVIDGHMRNGHPFRASPALYAIAVVDMSESKWDRALETLDRIADPNDPALAIAAPEIVEAAVRIDAPERAAVAFDLFAQRSTRTAAVAALPRLEACRALLAAPTDTDEHYRAAIARVQSARPFDGPRVQLLYGEHLRRGGRRSEAREHLRAALDGFDEIGARLWAERARRELQATGETARRRTPDAITQLTPQELQIARLVADGLTNKEVATQLYLSPRTIDAHLRAVFAKLGISSRKELPSFGFEGTAHRSAADEVDGR